MHTKHGHYFLICLISLVTQTLSAILVFYQTCKTLSGILPILDSTYLAAILLYEGV